MAWVEVTEYCTDDGCRCMHRDGVVVAEHDTAEAAVSEPQHHAGYERGYCVRDGRNVTAIVRRQWDWQGELAQDHAFLGVRNNRTVIGPCATEVEAIGLALEQHGAE